MATKKKTVKAARAMRGRGRSKAKPAVGKTARQKRLAGVTIGQRQRTVKSAAKTGTVTLARVRSAVRAVTKARAG